MNNNSNNNNIKNLLYLVSFSITSTFCRGWLVVPKKFMFTIIATIFVFLLSCCQGSKFDPVLAEHGIFYAATSYCQDYMVARNWTCDACLKASKNVTFVSISSGPNDMFAVTFLDHIAERVVVSFKGTDPRNIWNWVVDLNALRMVYPPANNSTTYVHAGFYQAYATMQPSIADAVRLGLGWFPFYSVHVTGHSMGAALATLGALDLLQQKVVTREEMNVYTYGGPRVGNSGFVDYASTLFRVRNVGMYRIVHNADLVAHIPPGYAGFAHMGTEVWYTENNANFTVCDGSGEDPRCSDSLWLKWGLLDHVYYFDIRVGSTCTPITKSTKKLIFLNDLQRLNKYTPVHIEQVKQRLFVE